MDTLINKTKTIKDSIHGYIEIEDEYMKAFVDTPIFQRLGRIEQTSMRVLYPSARHDRFIHSIGTFFLGKKAFQCFKSNIEQDDNLKAVIENFNCLQRSFEIACLLHDVGHAPFSHTCEDFYKEKKTVSGESEIDILLKGELKIVLSPNDYTEFLCDYEEVSPAPHEIVSSIVILKSFKESVKRLDGDLGLIIRSIVGCTYMDTSCERGIRNCLIRMLNSPVIDVDKLDYITRDSNLTGFSNSIIDTDRLLRSITAVKENGDDYFPAYNKNALSVIQNVISANNAQHAWIVNHHVVVYNTYLIQTIINRISKMVKPDQPNKFKEDLFSVDAIIGEQKCVNDFKVNMISDDDLWYLFKLYQNEIKEVDELLNRAKRKKAVWKTCAEFTLLFDDNKNRSSYSNGDFDFNKFKSMFQACCDDAKNYNYHIFNDKNASLGGLDLCNILTEFCNTKDIDVSDLVILEGGNPRKSKAVISRDMLRIRFFSGENGTKKYNNVMKFYQHEDIENNDTKKTHYFYLFSSKTIDKNQLCNFIKSHKKLKYRETV